jgi:hypothetical protein
MWGEKKKGRMPTVSDQSWEAFDNIARELELSASELIEWIGRGIITLEAQTDESKIDLVQGERKRRSPSVTDTGWKGFKELATSFEWCGSDEIKWRGASHLMEAIASGAVLLHMTTE